MRDSLIETWLNAALAERFPQSKPQAQVMAVETLRSSSLYLTVREMLQRRKVDYLFVSVNAFFREHDEEPVPREAHLLDLVNDADLLRGLPWTRRLPFYLTYAMSGPRRLFSVLTKEYDSPGRQQAVAEHRRQMAATPHEKQPWPGLASLIPHQKFDPILSAQDLRLKGARRANLDWEFFRRLQELAAGAGTKLVFVVSPRLAEVGRGSRLRALLDPSGDLAFAPLIQMDAAVLFQATTPDLRRSYFQDPLHLNAAGAEIHMKYFLPVLFDLLKERYR